MKTTNQKILLAVIGSKINYSLSPLIQNYFIKKHNLLAYYVPLTLQEKDFNKENIFKLFNSYNFVGLNVTYPYKENIFKLFNNQSSTAKNAGSANTIYYENNKLKIANFDGIACYKSFKDYLKIDLTTKKILFLGFGSTTKSILSAFKNKEINNITICNRTKSKVENYIKNNGNNYNILDFKNLKQEYKNYDIIINTTSLLLSELIAITSTKIIFYDVNYSKQNYIKMLKLKSKGVNYQDGIPMLCYQASFAFEKWFNILPLVNKNVIDYVYNNVDSWFNRSYC